MPNSFAEPTGGCRQGDDPGSLLAGFQQWFVVGIFLVFTAINFLDRQIFASLAPSIKAEFDLTSSSYGWLVSAFAMTYAFGAPLAGWICDRADVNRSISIAVIVWSLGGVGTGLGVSLASLIACRMALGMGESAGMPCLAKTNAIWLAPSQYAFSMAANNIAITVGSVAAPLLAAAMAPSFGWRSVFIVSGVTGLLWLPVWLTCSSRRPRLGGIWKREHTPAHRRLLRDRRVWALVFANALIMTVYTFWTNWTTLYFVQHLHLSEADTNRHYAWLPPICATIGAFAGGYVSFRCINRGMAPAEARMKGCWVVGAFLMLTAAVPLLKSPFLATMAIGATMFWAMNLQMNIHILPVDLFGREHAGFSTSLLACSFGLLQMMTSPIVGMTIDRFGFQDLCIVLALLPMCGIWIIKRFVLEKRPEASFHLIERPEHA